jgi:hypothetical protein
MAFSLKSLVSKSKERGKCIVIHGKGGIGKTTLAVDMCKEKNGVFIQSEDGMTSKKFDGVERTGVIDSWTGFTEVLETLALEDHDFKCIVVDTMDKFMPLLFDHILERDYGGNKDKAMAFRAYYQQQYQEFNAVLKAFEIIQNRGIDVVIIVHSVVESHKNPESEPYQRYGLNLPGGEKTNLASCLIDYSDFTLYAKEDIIVTEGKARGGNRVISTKMSPVYDTKKRDDMPDKIPLKWEELRKYVS